MCRGQELIKAIKDMDDEALDRTDVENLLYFLTKKREWIDKVLAFHSKYPDDPLDKSEEFLKTIGTPDLGLLESLNLWQFQQDCHATEQEICQSLDSCFSGVENVKKSKEFSLVVSTALRIISFIKGVKYPGFKIEDLNKLQDYKDNTNTNSLLYHVVKKVREVEPQFGGFPDHLLKSLSSMAGSDLAEVQAGLEKMEKTCR